MRVLSKLVYDEILSPIAVTYTNAELNDFLGRYDQMSIQAVVDQTTAPGYLIVHIEHSADGHNFVLKGVAIDTAGTGPGMGGYTATVTTVLTGVDQGISPSLGFVRLKVVNVFANSVHVKIHVTMRDQSGATPGVAAVLVGHAKGADDALELANNVRSTMHLF